MKEAELKGGELTITVDADGRYGWCGLSQIAHAAYEKTWLLTPAFTLEHYIGIPLSSEEYLEYEPCSVVKKLEAITINSCRLRYAPSAPSEIEFTADYQVSAPHYIDVVLTMKTRRRDWPLNHVALFFATIVNAPIYTGVTMVGHDKLIEDKQQNRWIHFNGTAVTQGKTAHPAGVEQPELPRLPHAPPTYFYSDSSIRFEQPFFFAPIENMVFAIMFQPKDREQVRFTVNPLAPAFGGPAWDFIWNINEPVTGKRYSIKFRSLFKPFLGKEDMLHEYDKFIMAS